MRPSISPPEVFGCGLADTEREKTSYQGTRLLGWNEGQGGGGGGRQSFRSYRAATGAAAPEGSSGGGGEAEVVGERWHGEGEGDERDGEEKQEEGRARQRNAARELVLGVVLAAPPPLAHIRRPESSGEERGDGDGDERVAGGRGGAGDIDQRR